MLVWSVNIDLDFRFVSMPVPLGLYLGLFDAQDTKSLWYLSCTTALFVINFQLYHFRILFSFQVADSADSVQFR